MNCTWCESEDIREGTKDCYWVMPDGRSTVRLLEVPAIDCPSCGTYVTESMAQKVEEALYLNDVSSLGKEFTYEALTRAPRITKSYFKR
ncbi:YokU family protein [Paenibacillus cremeus]|uniref:YokU family protein n=1 Tax=Paenibacillus cremeus TaxID=2163881 RepID=UPI0016453FEF|nr:YokU family protein [Paenibacillus cremeus]